MNKLLVILLATVLIKQIAWSAFIPLWQTPDEQAHYGQVNFTSELNRNELTTLNQSKEIAISEKLLGVDRDQFGNNKYTYHPDFNLSYAGGLEGIGEVEIKNISQHDRKVFVFQEATNYPPLYYRIAAVINNLFHTGSLIDRVFAVRFLSGILLVIMTYTTYRTYRMIGNETEAGVLAILVGWQPMLTFVHSGVTSDTLFNLLFTILIYLGIKVIVRGVDLVSLVSALIIIALGFATKPQANIMIFALLPAVVIRLWTNKKIREIGEIRVIGVMGGLVILVGLQQILGQILSGGIRIPNTEGVYFDPSVTPLEHLKFTLVHTYKEVLPWYWGIFRWLSLGLPNSLRQITNLLTIASFGGILVYLWRRIKDKSLDSRFWVVLYSLSVILIYWVALTVFDYGFRQSHGFSFGIQGRYFFPVILSQMIIFLVGLQNFFPEKWHARVGKLLGVGMIVLNMVVFFWVTSSYYQLSWPTFFLQASQYKTPWLKYPINLVILSAFVASSIILMKFILKEKKSTFPQG